MTVEEFITEIEGCYGEYLPAYRGYAGVWLRVNCLMEPMDLFRQLLETYSTRWNKPPGIVEMKEAIEMLHKQKTLEQLRAEADEAIAESKKRIEQLEGAKDDGR